jgi:lipocalin-like protein
LRLESAVVRTPDGQIVGYPFTRNPEGKLTYTRDGHMWAYVGARGPAGSERQALWYTGRFRIDLRRREVVHRVRYSSFRSYEGTDLRRRYRFDGRRRLTLSTVEGMVLRWVRSSPVE